MRGSKAKHLSSLFQSTIKKSSTKTSNSKSTPPKLKTLENLSLHQTTTSTKKKQPKVSPKSSKKSLSSSLQEFQKQQGLEESEQGLLKTIKNILGGNTAGIFGSPSLPASDVPNDEKPQKKAQEKPKEKPQEKNIEIPWISSTPNTSISHRQKVVSRVRKEKWVLKNTQNSRFQRLLNKCDEKLGTNATLTVFGRLRRESGFKEYRGLIGICIEKARESQDEDEALDHIYKAYELISTMKEQGFQVEDEIFGQLLRYLIDMKMVEEFHFFSELIKDENSAMLPRLGYYEMLLWISVDNEDKVQELCTNILLDADGDGIHLAEKYLLALCEANRKKEVMQLLKVVDITKFSSLESVSIMFKSMGRLLLQELAEKFVLALKTPEAEAKNLSYLICNYAINMPNLAVEDVISKFENLHEKLDVRPSSVSYEKLIKYCCDSLQVHAALAIVERMCLLDLALSAEIFYPILHAVEGSCELDLVHPIYAVIRRHNLKPKGKAMEILINLSVKMKDFEGAYNMLSDLKDMSISPTTSMYNALLAGYFREKKIYSGEMVLNQMKHADVKPDSRTFSYLIGNSKSEEDIIKYFEEMQSARVEVTKHVYMALINAYMNCGQFEKAKQVVLDQRIPAKHINDVKSVLVSALASCGQMSEALNLYDDIKQAGGHLEPKAVICLIEHAQPDGELDRLLQLLEELKDPDFWFDGCERVVSYCIQQKHLSSAINLLEQLRDHDKMSTYAVLDQVFCRISEIKPIDLQIGLDLLGAIKEKLNLCPSRTSLDFLLSACVGAKDAVCARLIWEEYEKAGLSYNVLTYLRMYQLQLACGEHKAAKKVLKKIPTNDPHVRTILKACDLAFCNSKPVKKK